MTSRLTPPILAESVTKFLVNDARRREGVAKLLSLTGVSKTYRDSRGSDLLALDDVSLDVEEREIVALIGPSGCGKSTLLRIIAGLETPDRPSLSWAVPPEPGKDIGFVFQESALLAWRSVRRNVGLGLEGHGRSKAEIRTRVDELLAMVGLSDFGDAYPRELSGGMKQRVGILRALAYDPRVLLMDEPFGALDAITRDRLQDDLLEIWEKTSKTIVLVTHSVEEAAYLADRVVVFSPRPGRIKAIHEVPLSRDRSPATRGTAGFAEFTALLRSELE